MTEETKPKTYRQKRIEKFLDKWFPMKPIRIPTSSEVKNAVTLNTTRR